MGHKENLVSVLLIDDDEATNYYNTLIIKTAGIAASILSLPTGKSALEYLRSPAGQNGSGEDEYPRPDLVFLDINMPVMDGWEFLEEHNRLPVEQKAGVVVMLTTSMNPDDEEHSRGAPGLAGFLHKPLSHEMLETVVKTHFAHLS